MYCPKCGSQMPDDAVYCPRCGYSPRYGTNAASSQEPSYGGYPYTEGAAADHRKPLSKMAGSGQFLAVCILLSVALGASVLTGTINVLLILCVIGVWMMYASTTSDPTLMSKGLKVIKVSLKIQYVVFYVAMVLMLVAGLIFIVALNAVGDSVDEIFELSSDFLELDEDGAYILELFGDYMGIFAFTVFTAAAGLMLVINLVFHKDFLSRANDIYTSFEDNLPVRINHKSFAAKLLVYGFLFSGSGRTTDKTDSTLMLISYGCMLAAVIISFILIRKQEKTY